jgi:hypothetical protein
LEEPREEPRVAGGTAACALRARSSAAGAAPARPGARPARRPPSRSEADGPGYMRRSSRLPCWQAASPVRASGSPLRDPGHERSAHRVLDDAGPLERGNARSGLQRRVHAERRENAMLTNAVPAIEIEPGCHRAELSHVHVIMLVELDCVLSSWSRGIRRSGTGRSARWQDGNPTRRCTGRTCRRSCWGHGRRPDRRGRGRRGRGEHDGRRDLFQCDDCLLRGHDCSPGGRCDRRVV